LHTPRKFCSLEIYLTGQSIEPSLGTGCRFGHGNMAFRSLRLEYTATPCSGSNLPAAHGPRLLASCYTTYRVQSYTNGVWRDVRGFLLPCTVQLRLESATWKQREDVTCRPMMAMIEPLVQIWARYMLADAMGVRSCNATYHNWCSSSGRIGLRSYSYVSCTAEFIHLGHASSMLSVLLRSPAKCAEPVRETSADRYWSYRCMCSAIWWQNIRSINSAVTWWQSIRSIYCNTVLSNHELIRL
jgi:hypothetical protein